jgi:hypothetical protein
MKNLNYKDFYLSNLLDNLDFKVRIIKVNIIVWFI